MTRTPPDSLIILIHSNLAELLRQNPAATSSEAYVQHHMQFSIIKENVTPRYYLRIGINYHGNKVQHIGIDDKSGFLVGWNPKGDALGTGKNAKVLLAGMTIFDREENEPLMNDTKVGGGDVEKDGYIRIEFKARGWLGQTKNLNGKELEKDLNLLKEDNADLLVICLSETAHRKWRGEGAAHQSKRRKGVERFQQILLPPENINGEEIVRHQINFEGQQWNISAQRVIGSPNSIMPGAENFVTLIWR